MCHLVLAMPIISLPIFYFLPAEIASPIYFFILLLSFAVYYAVAKVMMKPAVTGMDAMIGGLAEVLEELKPEGKIQYRNEIWDAYLRGGASRGETVRIVGFEGLKALVENNMGAASGAEQSASSECKLHIRR